MKRWSSASVCLPTVLAAALFAPAVAGEHDRMVAANDRFAVALFQQLAERPGNVLVAPYGVSLALAMTGLGASGATSEQFKRTLRIEEAHTNWPSAFSRLNTAVKRSATDGVDLRIAGRLWLQEGWPVEDACRRHYRELFGVEPSSLDFLHGGKEAVRTINATISRDTAGAVAEMLSDNDLSDRTALIVLAAVVFHGEWRSGFAADQTEEAEFDVSAARTVLAPMMRQINRLPLARRDGMTLLELPYRGTLSMVIILPDEPEGVTKLGKELTVDQLNRWVSVRAVREVDVRIPRFSIQQSHSLRPVLSKMGLEAAFDPMRASFSALSPRNPLALSMVVHEARVMVNEEGTRAVAATAAGGEFGPGDARPSLSPVVFHADHPFLFLITENTTGTILFLGRVAEPR